MTEPAILGANSRPYLGHTRLFPRVACVIILIFPLVGCPGPWPQLPLPDSSYDPPMPMYWFSYQVIVPDSNMIHSFEFKVETASSTISVILESEMNNEIVPGESRNTTIDPDSGYLVELECINDSSFVLRVTAKPMLYPEGMFLAMSTFLISVRANAEPLNHSIAFFKADGLELP